MNVHFNKDKFRIYALKGLIYYTLRKVIDCRGIRFREEPWMRSYIELNMRLGANGKNDFEKDFFKLMNNSVFGKTMENIRNRVDVKLVSDRRAAEKLSAKRNFEHLTIFDENLVAIHMKRTKLTFNKPVYCGMAILDLMYDFHYGYILPKYGKNQKLLFTDTDSLCYEIETEDVYKDISEDVEKGFDTNNFPKDHPSGIPVGKNKKIPGMMKDKAGGIVQSIYLFHPSQIATESFSSPFFSEKHTFHHIKSLEKSKKGKIQNFYCDNTAPQVRHENEAAYSNLLLHGSFDQQFTIIQSSGSKGKDR